MPYSAGEESSYLLAVNLAPRRSDVGRCWVVCATLGAGLRGPEVAGAEGGDLVDVAAGRVGLRVRGRNARLVPIRADYNDLALWIRHTRPIGRLIGSTARGAVHKLLVLCPQTFARVC